MQIFKKTVGFAYSNFALQIYKNPHGNIRFNAS